MARKARKKQAGKKRLEDLEVGQRVVVEGFGRGIVIALECRRGMHYSDVWVRPDDNQAREIGLPYRHGIVRSE